MNRFLLALSLTLVTASFALAGVAGAATVNFGAPKASPAYFSLVPKRIALGQAGTTLPPLDLFAAYGTFGSSTVMSRITSSHGEWHFTGANSITTQSLAASNTPQDVAVGDVNGDGNDDIGVATLGGVQIARGSAGGAFTALASPAGTSFNPSSGVVFARINADLLPDMLVATPTAVELYQNTGNSTAPFNTFAGISSPGGITFADVAVGDFDGDGDNDVASASATDNRVYAHFGNGAGSFSAGISIGLFSRPGSLAAADVNADGRAEILAAEPDRGTVAIVGTGLVPTSLGPVTRVATGYSPVQVEVADLDSDGKPEIVTANAASDSVTVSTVGGSTNSYAAGPNPVSVALGDVTGDGRADIVVANEPTLNVSILENLGTPAAPPTPAKGSARLTCRQKTSRRKVIRVDCSVRLSSVSGATRFTARLKKSRKTLKTVRVTAGKRLSFKFPKGLAAGRYSVSLSVIAASGNVTASRTLAVRKRR